MSKPNKHGLRRHIPAPVKRLVRQRCGFGCVVCGASIIDYHHEGPEFKDAKRHDPERIALLCMQHHGKRTRGSLSTETVLAALNDPYCRRSGFSWDDLDIGTAEPLIVIAGTTISACRVALTVNGIPRIEVLSPEQPNGPMRLNAELFDDTGQRLFRIRENQFQASSDSWDCEQVGRTITIRESSEKIALMMTVEPPQRIYFDHIDLRFKGARLLGDRDTGTIVRADGKTMIRLAKNISHSNGVGLAINV